MSRVRAHEDHDVEQMTAIAERFAVCAVRRSLRCAARGAQDPQDLPALGADLQEAGALLRRAHGMMLRLQGSGLRVAPPGAAALTRHERRLLRATAAAQTDDIWIMDNYLFKLAPNRHARPALALAVTTFAFSLATMKHWLPAFPFPVDALAIARS